MAFLASLHFIVQQDYKMKMDICIFIDVPQDGYMYIY